ncbi:MAG TPA: hypothetical protein VF984_06415 [Actinomycetota bacterium]
MGEEPVARDRAGVTTHRAWRRRTLRLSVEIDLFAAAAVALWFAGSRDAAVVLAIAGVTTSVLNLATESAGRALSDGRDSVPPQGFPPAGWLG